MTLLALRSQVEKLKAEAGGVLVPADLGALWTPRSEPQRMALESEADEIYYGGAAGGGVTELLAPIADQVAYNGTDRRWRLPGHRFIELGAAQHEDSERKWRGRPHDGKLFDELPEFTEKQYLFFSGWARTTIPGQKVQTI